MSIRSVKSLLETVSPSTDFTAADSLSFNHSTATKSKPVICLGGRSVLINNSGGSNSASNGKKMVGRPDGAHRSSIRSNLS